MRKTSRFLAAGAVVIGVSGCFVAPASAQTVPIPEPPPEAEPALGVLSPAGWTACSAGGLAFFGLALAGSLVPVPPPLPTPGSVITTIAPVTSTVFGMCSLMPLPDPMPDCPTPDATTATVPLVGPRPAGFLVVQLAAIEGAATAAGAPTVGVAPTVGGQLGCVTPPEVEEGDSVSAAVPPLPELFDPSAGTAGTDSVTTGAGSIGGGGASGAIDRRVGSQTATVTPNEAVTGTDGTTLAAAPASATSTETWTPLRVAGVVLAFLIGGAALAGMSRPEPQKYKL